MIKKLWEYRKSIWFGYTNLLKAKLGLADKRIEKLAAYRKDVIESRCKCIDYLVDFKLFGKEIRLFGYCRYCKCLEEAKIRSEEEKCPFKRW